MFNRVLIAIDHSTPAARAAHVGFELAKQLEAAVALVHVVDVNIASAPELIVIRGEELRQLRAAGERLLRDVQIRFPHSLRAERMLVEGEPAESIVNTAREWKADLVIIGSDSRGRLAHFLVGSTADAVIRRAPCPVLTVRLQPGDPGANNRELFATEERHAQSIA